MFLNNLTTGWVDGPLESEDFINKLPRHLTLSLIYHYMDLHRNVQTQLAKLGIETFDLDFADCNFWLITGFRNYKEAGYFLDLVEYDNYPSGVEWFVEEDHGDGVESLAVFIPRMDLFIVLRMLQRITALFYGP